jgi:hypothetical protein
MEKPDLMYNWVSSLTRVSFQVAQLYTTFGSTSHTIEFQDMNVIQDLYRTCDAVHSSGAQLNLISPYLPQVSP